MDRLSALLDGPRARGAFVLRSLLVPPWSLAIRDLAPLAVIAVIRGDAWIRRGDEVTRLQPGSVALVRGPHPYVVSSGPEVPPDIVIHPGQRCETLSGDCLAMSMRLGVLTWGHALDAPTVMLTGIYEQHSSLGQDLLDALPDVIAVDRPVDDPLVALLAREITNDAPGQQSVLDRLLDALTVDTLREWFAHHDDGPGWWSGHGDPIVGDALRLIHDDPCGTWTVASLASAVGTSRANLARRFTDVVGEPVITYLTNWRLSLAADLLTQPGATVSSVAASVGYSTPFALSTAFKRRYGVSPHRHRTAQRVPIDAPTHSSSILGS